MTGPFLVAQTTEAFDVQAFRQALGTFPTGVAIITTLDKDGQVVGLTCNSFSSVSLDPPLVLWSLRKASKNLVAFRQATGFVINILTQDQVELSSRFASSSVKDKFDGVGHTFNPEGFPLIANCIARFHCTSFAEHEAGDHVIFIGQVTRFEHAPQDDPLVFYKGAYMMLTESLRQWASEARVSTNALVEARVSIYRLLLTMACDRATSEDLQAIENHLFSMDGMTGRGEMADRARAALEFFNLITEAAHNDVLGVVSKSLGVLMRHSVNAQGMQLTWPALHQPELTPIRWSILAALKQNDSHRACAALDEYFEHVLRFQSSLSAHSGS